METNLMNGHNELRALLEKLAETLPEERLMALVVLGVVFPDDLARMFGKDTQTIKNAMSRRELPYTRWGNTTVHLVESLKDWLKERETKPHGGN